ncbi:MAG: cysteine desulfurase [Bdellovibrionales bacterium]|nr:cysteine desulfurase [Oligoflexia bacterium]
MIYLDGHSTTSLDPKVFEFMKPYFMERFGNASRGIHRYNWEAEAGVEHARKQLANLIGAHEKEIIFTSGATESNHLAILGLAPDLVKRKKRKILSIGIEHSSLLGALELLSKQDFRIEWVKTTACGRVDHDDYLSKLSSEVGLVTFALANHEIGTIQDIAQLSKLAHEQGAYFHTDAVQALGKVPFTVDGLGVDLMTLSGHKVHGPKGVGVLYVRRKNPRVELEALFWGGSQERGLRPGTPDTPAIVGFGAAAEILQNDATEECIRIANLRDLLWRKLKEGLPCLIRNGSFEHCLPNNLNVSVVGVDGSALFGRLKKVAVSNASACLNGSQDYSQVLTLLGVERDLARSTLRFGLGRFTTESEILEAAEEVIQVVHELRLMEKEFAEQSGVTYKAGDCVK